MNDWMLFWSWRVAISSSVDVFLLPLSSSARASIPLRRGGAQRSNAMTLQCRLSAEYVTKWQLMSCTSFVVIATNAVSYFQRRRRLSLLTSREYSVHPLLSVCLFVRSITRKRMNSSSSNLVYSEWPRWVVCSEVERSNVKVTESQSTNRIEGDRVAAWVCKLYRVLLSTPAV